MHQGATDTITVHGSRSKASCVSRVVVTMYMLTVHPDANNRNPGRVEFTLDIRCQTEDVHGQMMGEIRIALA